MIGNEITAIDPSYPHRSDRYPSSQVPKLRAPDTGTFRGYLSLKSSLKKSVHLQASVSHHAKLDTLLSRPNIISLSNTV